MLFLRHTTGGSQTSVSQKEVPCDLNAHHKAEHLHGCFYGLSEFNYIGFL